MRRRAAAVGVRERLIAEYEHLTEITGDVDVYPNGFGMVLAQLKAGEPVTVHAYEIDMSPLGPDVRVESDGTVTVLEL